MCEMCMCLARGGVGVEGCEWMRGLGLGFTTPAETEEVLDVCLCFGGGGVGVGGIGGEWVESLDQGQDGWYYVCVMSLDYLCR